MQVIGIGWAGVLTEDFESTVGFFSDLLGLSFAYRDEAKELAHVRFQSGQLLEVYGASNRGRKEKYQFFQGPALGFEVENVQLARQEMIARGARFITELETWENDMWTMFLGPDDKLFEILRPTRSPAERGGRVSGIRGARTFVRDFEDAMRFCSLVLEMTPAQKDDGNEFARFCLPTGHVFEVLGARSQRGDLGPSTVIGFEVDDMAGARDEMESRGLQFVGPSEFMDDGSTRSQFRAPDRFGYELIYDPKHAPH